MIFKDTGEVSPGFHVLTSNRMPAYLLDGKHPVIFDSGLSCMGRAYEQAARKVLNHKQPEILFLTHMHFDHCGAAAYLKKAFAGLKVAASQRASEILARPGALKLIAELNAKAGKVACLREPNTFSPGDLFQPFDVDIVLKDGDRIELGEGLSVEVLATPGHTWDFLSYYIPERKILVASEAAGCADLSGYIVTEFLVDFRAYMDSLQRLAALDVEVLCQGHHMVYLGRDAREYFSRSIQTAQDFKERVEDLLISEEGNVERVIALIKAQDYDSKPEPKQFEPAYLLNLSARVRHLAQVLESKDGWNRLTSAANQG